MANPVAADLMKKSDAAFANLRRQLEGMGAHLDRADAPGEWTTREVLGHLLAEPGFDPGKLLRSFADRDLPTIEIESSATHITPERQAASLDELVRDLDGQRQSLFAYLESVGEAELARKAHVPLFKQFMGTDEIAVPVFVGAMFDYHWNDHASQIAKIRKAAGLPAAPAS